MNLFSFKKVSWQKCNIKQFYIYDSVPQNAHKPSVLS